MLEFLYFIQFFFFYVYENFPFAPTLCNKFYFDNQIPNYQRRLWKNKHSKYWKHSYFGPFWYFSDEIFHLFSEIKSEFNLMNLFILSRIQIITIYQIDHFSIEKKIISTLNVLFQCLQTLSQRFNIDFQTRNFLSVVGPKFL